MRPARLLFILLIAWSAAGLAAALQPNLAALWQAGGIALFLAAGFDAWQGWRLRMPRIERRVPASLALSTWREISLILDNPAPHALQLDVFDAYPPHCDWQGMPQLLQLPARSQTEIRYRVRPLRRGEIEFSGVHLLLHSPGRLWKFFRYAPLPMPARVYPNFATVTKYTLLATENRLGQLGIRKIQRRGEGLDFLQLREYRPGDALRQIDWNATSRLKKLISKEYQDERDQQIVFLIDCGRRMLSQDGALSHFDHTLNAVLLLSYVALRQGDALALLTFSGEQRWMSPRKGLNTINVVLNTLYDLQPTLLPSDYQQAALNLMQRLRKRALVILISNLRDEENSELLPALQLLRRKHLVLLANLREKVINEALEQPIASFDDALRHAAAQDYLGQRRAAYDALTGHGIMHLDVEPAQLAVSMVNRYLEIKRGGVL
jgi:uncharacterized protein (DUF58 family)